MRNRIQGKRRKAQAAENQKHGTANTEQRAQHTPSASATMSFDDPSLSVAASALA